MAVVRSVLDCLRVICNKAAIERKLFEILIRHTPEHLWYSPVCAPWCMWSFLNCTKNIDTGLKIMEQRWQNLWQLSLAVVLYRFQKSHNAQFSLEQPSGSLMLKVPCMDEIVSSLSWCQFDMCQVGNLVHPRDFRANSKTHDRVHFVPSIASIFAR